MQKKAEKNSLSYKLLFISMFLVLMIVWWIFEFGLHAKDMGVNSNNFDVISLYFFAFYAVVIYAYFLLFSESSFVTNSNSYLYFLIIATLIRLILGINTTGHPIDINCFRAWMNIAATEPFELYEKGIFIDYFPGYLIIIGLIKSIAVKLSINNTIDTFLVKIPNIMSDIGIVLLLGTLKQHGTKNEKKIEIFVALSPVLILLSSMWGQTDNFVLFLFMLYVLCIRYNWYTFGGVVLGFLTFTKPQVLLFLPAVFFTWLYRLMGKKDVKFVFGEIIGFIIVCAGFYLAFMPYHNYLWLIEFYKKIAGEYPYYTVNAYNIYYALGLNWVKLGSMYNIINIIVLLFVYTLSVLILISKFDNKTRKNDNEDTFAYAEGLCTSFFLIGLVTFNFMTGMHERYLIYTLIFSLLVFKFTRKEKWFFITIGISILSFINTADVLKYAFRNTYFIKQDAMNTIVSCINCFASVLIVTVLTLEALKIKSQQIKFK
ncbi:hypothetical protein [Caldicellulosiruptor morganii]|uniref:DUF2029 domain-containing protein n=1 Tax=Caldicellulosiruptor morganii TaxID=1387555 RepID=A0ABY7BLD1_9FIRM|nr:hypothetical protein [Caldicellulosiruptor morganii]WAM33657.1 hypothetical protein OTK00_002179 [Caldicellulosiruptor morganii]